MNFKNLEYFLVLSEEMSFSKAADRLYISQQALSGAISRIESEYNIALFERKHPLRLTAAGSILAKAASDILTAKRNVENTLSLMANDSVVRIAIGVTNARGNAWIPQIVPPFKKLYPNAIIDLLQGSSEYCESCLLKGQVDFIISGITFQSPQICSQIIGEERYCFVVPDSIMRDLYGAQKDEKVKAFKGGVSIREFASSPFMLMKHGHTLRGTAERIFREANLQPNTILEGDSCEVLFNLTFKSLGISIWPDKLIYPKLKMLLPSEIEKIHIFPIDCLITKQPVLVGYLPNNPLSKPAADFVFLVKNLLEDYAYNDSDIWNCNHPL